MHNEIEQLFNGLKAFHNAIRANGDIEDATYALKGQCAQFMSSLSDQHKQALERHLEGCEGIDQGFEKDLFKELHFKFNQLLRILETENENNPNTYSDEELKILQTCSCVSEVAGYSPNVDMLANQFHQLAEEMYQ